MQLPKEQTMVDRAEAILLKKLEAALPAGTEIAVECGGGRFSYGTVTRVHRGGRVTYQSAKSGRYHNKHYSLIHTR